MDNKKIGKFISSLRKKKSMTQQNLAHKLGVTNKAISKWETGEGYPELTIIPHLAKELGITVDELLAGEYTNNHNQNIITSKNTTTLESVTLKYKMFNSIAFFITLLGIIIFILFALTWPNLKLVGFSVFLLLISTSFIILSIAFHKTINDYQLNFNEVGGNTSSLIINKLKRNFIWKNSILIIILAFSFPTFLSIYMGSPRYLMLDSLYTIVALFVSTIAIFLLRIKVKRL